MQIILMILFLSWAHAQEQCDPVQAEKECFNLLCTQTPKKLIPLDTNELISAVQNHQYELHPEVKEGFDLLAKLGQSVKETSKKILADNGHQKIAEDFINSPMEGQRQLEFLFEGEFKCIYTTEGTCDLVTNDLTTYPEGLRTLYKNLSESTFVFREGAALSIKDKKKFYLKALEKLEGTKSRDFIQAEKRKISQFKQEFDFILYQTNASWLSDYLNLVAKESSGFMPALSESIKLRMNEMLNLDLGSEAAKARVHESCKITSYVKTILDQNVNTQKFDEQTKKIMESFKTKFLPLLSEKSSRELQSILSEDTFILINQNLNDHPYSPNLSVHRNGYVKPETSFDIIRDLNLLNQGRSYRCNLGARLIGDSFNYGNGMISVSKFVLANGYGDAITHELGHWLSAQIKDKNMSYSSRRKLLKARKCVLKNYPKDDSKALYFLQHKGDHVRTEEDFADWFTAKAGLGENGLFCDLKKVTANLLGKGTESVYLPEAGDPHSNYLFREINLRLNRGETLPQSCKDLIDVHPENAPQKCDI